jgi:hypothetical protein
VNVHAVLRQCALDLLETEPHVTVEHVVNCAYQHHGFMRPRSANARPQPRSGRCPWCWSR